MVRRKSTARTTAKKKTATRGKPALKVGDEAVAAKTGKTWAQWCVALDRDGARSMSHKEIVATVAKKYRIGPWWQQMVTVGYEQSRGLRAKHEKPMGFEISRSKTLNAPVSEIFEAWGNVRRRAAWLPGEKPAVRKATENKSLRITWTDGTNVEVMLYPKAAGRTQVSVQHGRLPTARAGEKLKAFWGEALERLGKLLAT